ncbi:MAG: pseudaminic acid synthase [Proteobacteria bacterium]|nr:pseudaminic acid synthase [Pseudomonadota bacterium]MBU1709842.1 pseudaminic acid synthase [Pseudomonadota bacterium]
MESIQIGNRTLGNKFTPFIIAEMSGNHNQSLEHALTIVKEVASCGAHALKLQTYTAAIMTLDISDREFRINDRESPWYGRTLYDLYQKAHTPWDWHKPIFDLCKELGLICFSTPFDETAVDFLESLNVPCYKVASFENIDLPLIKKVAATGKPLLISTGMATIAELDEAVRTAREAGCKDLILLKCTSTYPASPEDSNLQTIPHLRDLFACEVGLSDHTMGIGTAITAVALGASVIEKHFTLSRDAGGVDSSFSIEPAEMRALVVEAENAWKSLGTITYGPTEKETASLVFRRSIYVVEDMNKGDVFTKDNLRVIRPGYGLQPKHYEAIIGKKINKSVTRGTALLWDLID